MSLPVLRFLVKVNPNLSDDLKEIAEECAVLARSMDAALLDGPEKAAGMRKLLEAKDCFVRAALTETEE